MRRWTIPGLVVTMALPTILAAQADSASAPDISRRALVRGAVATVLVTGALMPLDPTIARHMQRLRVQGGGTGERIANVMNWAGDPGVAVASLGLIGAGWLTHHPRLFDVGLRAAVSVGISGGIGTLLKGTTGRARPAMNSADADDFTAGAGFGKESRTSFPSGHTTVAFAFATAVTMGTKEYAPHYAHIVGLTSYGLATAVGMARLYTNHHWTSDVVLGAGIGTLTGLAVEHVVARRQQIAGHHTTIWPATITPVSPHAVAMIWTMPF